MNALATYDGVGGYFLDLRATTRGGGVLAGTQAEQALGWWERHIRGEDAAASRFGESVARLREAAEAREGLLLWRAPGDDGRAYCAAAQGQAASVLVREYLRTRDQRRAADAHAAIAPLAEPGSPLELGNPPVPGKRPIPADGHVLNGLIFALWGVRDVALGLGDPGARDVYEGGVEALAASLSYYDTGWWTRYSLDRDGWDLAAPGWHRLHVTQMEVMARLTRRGEFVRAARRWRRYDAAWNRARRRVAMIRTALEGSPRPAWTGPPRVRAVVHHAYPSDPRVRRESLTLRDAGLDVEVVCQRDPGQRRRELVEGLPVTRLDVEHVDRSALRGVLREYFGFTAAAAVALASGAPEARPELIHVHAPPDFLLAAALVPRLRGARLLLDIHDLSRDMFTSRFGDGIAGRAGAAVLAAVERLACASADEVVTVHQPYADELARRGVRPQKISVVMNAIDERSLEPARRRRKRGDEHEGFTVAYHGTVTQWYGLDLVIEALALARADIPGIRAIVIGVGDAMEPTRRLAAELGLGDRVEFLDAMPQEATLERIATADCGVIPNKPTTLNRFALSSKLFEYVALGIPVAVARLETLARHFDDDEVAFFAPGDFGALASALVSIAKDPRAATARAERARARAQADYSWTSNRDDLLTRVFELVPEPPTALWRPSWWRAAPTATAGS